LSITTAGIGHGVGHVAASILASALSSAPQLREAAGHAYGAAYEKGIEYSVDEEMEAPEPRFTGHQCDNCYAVSIPNSLKSESLTTLVLLRRIL
jgi:hypothetical protein